jgi:transcriptional regulator with XRE-family HTH domain
MTRRRDELGVSQDDISATCKMPAQTFSRIERGLLGASPERQARIAKALGVPIDELFLPETRQHAERDARIVERYREGESAPALAKGYQLSRSRVSRIVAQARATRDRAVPVETLDQLRRLHAEGKRDHEIAAVIGVSRTRAAQLRRELELPAQPPARKHPVPDERVCPTCGKHHKPSAPQVAKGYGEFCSRPCARQSPQGREIGRRSATTAHTRSAAELGQVKIERDVVTLAEIAAELKIAENTISGRYIPRGYLGAERVQHGIETVWLVERAEYERFKRESWPALRKKAIDCLPDFVIARMSNRSRQRWGGRVNGAKAPAPGARSRGRPPTTLNPSQRKKVERLARRGWGRRAIASQLRVSEQAVRTAIAELPPAA